MIDLDAKTKALINNLQSEDGHTFVTVTNNSIAVTEKVTIKRPEEKSSFLHQEVMKVDLFKDVPKSWNLPCEKMIYFPRSSDGAKNAESEYGRGLCIANTHKRNSPVKYFSMNKFSGINSNIPSINEIPKSDVKDEFEKTIKFAVFGNADGFSGLQIINKVSFSKALRK